MATRLTNRAERLIALEQLLFRSTSGLRAVEIADACGVDRRTAYRDLALLEEIGVPIFQRDGRFFVDREHYLATIRLSMDESLALLLVASESPQQSPHLGSAISKLGHVLPTPFATQDFKFDALNAPHVQTITEAWYAQREIKVWYSGRDGVRVKVSEFSTYFIRPKRSGTSGEDEIYLVGLENLNGRVRAINLSRIRKVEAVGLQESYELRRHPFYVRGSSKGDDAELG
ncbi:MAG: HTH domain-containing protein [Anaerolinea sp.]|nr:HTH domain-containing protein [Anaerolinea sp.]